MEADRARIEAARRRNLEFIRALDEQEAAAAADEFLASMSGSIGGQTASVEQEQRPKAAKGNASVYVTGLATYMACRQLEAMCGKIGKVRRIKFYKDDRGGLKGDAVVAFHSAAAAQRAIERLNGFEIKPGVTVTASPADFSKKGETTSTEAASNDTMVSDASNVQQVSPRSDERFRSVILQNVWNPLEPQEEGSFFSDLEDDMREGCSKHGQIEHVRRLLRRYFPFARAASHAADIWKQVQIVADGSVVVRFVEVSSAIECQQAMQGRWFAGRQIETQLENEPTKEEESTKEPIDADDAKLDEFLASIDS